MHRFVTAVVVGTVALVATSFPARGDPGPSPSGNRDNVGWTDGQGVGAGAQSPSDGGSITPVASRSASAAPVCSYQALDAAESVTADDMAANGWGPPRGQPGGAWYRKICVDANGMSSGVIVWGAGPAVDPAALAQQALGYTPMPNPAVGMSPPQGREQLVNLTTFLWIDRAQWQPVSASASAGGVMVVTTATPQRVVWSMGNGDSVTCEGPGVPYDPSRSDADQPDPCRYTYRHSSADQPGGTFTVMATVEWQVTWVATGAPAGAPGAGNLGVVGRSSSFPVRVGEAEATNTSRT